MIELRAKATGEAHCPFCREDLAGLALHTCSGCQVVYHEACARELPTCATLGCEELLKPVRSPEGRSLEDREEFSEEDWEPALQPAEAEEVQPTCSGCLQLLRGLQHTCPECEAVYHPPCAYDEGTCRRCEARLFPVRRRTFRERSLDLFDGFMEGAVGFACVGGIVVVVAVMGYIMNHLSPTTLEENMPLLLSLSPLIMGVSLGAGMLAKRVWRDHYREIRRRAPR